MDPNMPFRDAGGGISPNDGPAPEPPLAASVEPMNPRLATRQDFNDLPGAVEPPGAAALQATPPQDMNTPNQMPRNPTAQIAGTHVAPTPADPSMAAELARLKEENQNLRNGLAGSRETEKEMRRLRLEMRAMRSGAVAPQAPPQPSPPPFDEEKLNEPLTMGAYLQMQSRITQFQQAQNQAAMAIERAGLTPQIIQQVLAIPEYSYLQNLAEPQRTASIIEAAQIEGLTGNGAQATPATPATPPALVAPQTMTTMHRVVPTPEVGAPTSTQDGSSEQTNRLASLQAQYEQTRNIGNRAERERQQGQILTEMAAMQGMTVDQLLARSFSMS